MTTEARYLDLLAGIPTGSYYSSTGVVIPYNNRPTQLRLVTIYPNTKFLILVNDVNSGMVLTDVNGNAIINVQLPLGDITIELQREFSTEKIKAYVTTREYSNWLAAIAEQFESLDDSTTTALNTFYLDKAGSTDIDLAHGVLLQFPNESVAELDAYRETLQLVRQSMRYFAGRLSGKYGVVAALTQINPIVFERFKDGPRWILGYDLIFGEHYSRVPYGTLPLLNVGGQFVTLKSVDEITAAGNGTIVWSDYFKRFSWTPPDPTSYPYWVPSQFYSNDLVIANGEVQIKGYRELAKVEGMFTPYLINEGLNDHLYLEIDRRNIVNVWLALKNTALLSVDTTINAFLASVDSYESARSILTQPAGALAQYLQIVRVSDSSNIGTGTVDFNASVQARYQAPGDSYGSPVAIPFTPGTIRLYSTNGNWIDVLTCDNGAAPVATDTFTIEKKYDGATKAARSVGSQLIIGSRNTNPDDHSEVIVHPGPADAAAFYKGPQKRGLFDTPKISTSLSVAASIGNTSIQVPTGSWQQFNGGSDCPFDIVVGRGITTQLARFSITPDADTHTARVSTIANTTATLFKDRDDYVSLISNGAYCITRTPNTRVLVTGLTSNTPAGTASVQTATVGPNRVIRYRAPTDGSYGANIILSAFSPGSYTVSSSTTAYKITVYVSIAPCPIFTGSFSVGVENHGMDGVHRIIEHISSTSVRIAYNGLKNSQPLSVTGVSIIKVNAIYGTGTLAYSAGTLTWTSPTDIAGSAVAVPVDGHYRLYSNNGSYVDVVVDVSLLPALPATDNITVGEFYTIALGGNDDLCWRFSDGEKCRVTSVTVGATEVWNLESILTRDHEITSDVYLYNNEYPLKRVGRDDLGALTVDADLTFNPTGVVVDTVSVVGSDLPDGWLSVSSHPTYLTPDSLLSDKALVTLDATGGTVILEKVVPLKPGMLGKIHTLSAWIRSKAATAVTQQYQVSYDFGGSTWPSTTFSILDPETTVRQPAQFSLQFLIPPTATGLRIRISRLPATPPDSFILERVVLTSAGNGLFLGDNTTPRSYGRSVYGTMLYVWSPNQLSTAEATLLGIAVPAAGAIRNSFNVHEQVEAWDVTDIVSGSVVNVRGAVTDVDWGLAALKNMEIIPRVPDRFSYIKPTIVSTKTEEAVFSQIAPYLATLSVESNQDENQAILYENGIPLPVNQWQFNTGTQVEITSGFVPGATYTIEYAALIQVEIAPIDIQAPLPNGNDTWFADYVAWNRQSSEIITTRKAVAVIFDTRYNARLPKSSDQNKLTSVLTEDTGIARRIIPQESWDYVDSLNITINSGEFNSDAIYSIEYNQQLVDTTRVATIKAEIRSSPTVFSLGLAPYYEFKINDAIDATMRYHQIRLTISGVVDTRDVRIHSATVRGLRLYTSPVVPGF
jgi:hypothetical protein